MFFFAGQGRAPCLSRFGLFQALLIGCSILPDLCLPYQTSGVKHCGALCPRPHPKTPIPACSFTGAAETCHILTLHFALPYLLLLNLIASDLQHFPNFTFTYALARCAFVGPVTSPFLSALGDPSSSCPVCPPSRERGQLFLHAPFLKSVSHELRTRRGNQEKYEPSPSFQNTSFAMLTLPSFILILRRRFLF